MKCLDRFLKKRATVSEIILHDAVEAGVQRPGRLPCLLSLPALLNCAYSVTSSRFSSSRSAVALGRAFVRALGANWGKKTVIGTPCPRQYFAARQTACYSQSVPCPRSLEIFADNRPIELRELRIRPALNAVVPFDRSIDPRSIGHPST
jgi:hypothetical protein